MMERGLVAEHATGGQGAQSRLRRGGDAIVHERYGTAVAEDGAGRDEAVAIDGQAVRRGRVRGGQFDGRDREFIAGERAGLVGGDQRATAEPLDRGQPSHDGAAGRHPAGGDGQRDRQRHGQAFWDRRHGQHHCEEKHFLWPLTDHHAEQPDRRGGRDDCDRD